MLVSLQTVSQRSKPCSFGQVDAEPIAPALVSARHFSGCMTQLLLNVSLIDVSARGQTRTQTVAREQGEAILFWQLAADNRAT